eukprot:scaffold7745_cov103-Cylindrotheca_fusiformis.AAC.3
MEAPPSNGEGKDDHDKRQHGANNTGILSLSELSLRLHCPVDYRQVLPRISEDMKKHPETSLSYIPWKLNQPSAALNDTTTSKKDAVERSLPGKTTATKNNPSEEKQQHIFFPSYSYLDLRRQQNTRWASGKHKEGMEHFFINPTKAESKFLEGLDLVPDHVDLLASYGKLLLSNDKFVSAETKLRRALSIDPNHRLAKEQLDRLERRQALVEGRERKKKDIELSRKIKVVRESSVYNDVLMERALASGCDDDDDGDKNAQEEDSSRRINREDKKRSRRSRKDSKRKKKKRRKRRRRYYSSSSASSSVSSDIASLPSNHSRTNKDASVHDAKGDDGVPQTSDIDHDASREKRQNRKDYKRKKKKRWKRWRRYYSSSSASSSVSSDIASVPSNHSSTNKDSSVRDAKGDDVVPQTSDINDDASREERKRRKDRQRRKHHDRKYRSKKKRR